MSFAAALIGVIAQLDELADVVQGKAQVARVTNEGKALKALIAVAALIAGRTFRWCDKPSLLVVTNCGDLHTGFVAEFANTEHKLEPLVARAIIVCAMAGHHHHHHIDPEAGDARVFWAVIVNLVLTAAQIIGGILSGSLALIADAIHNLSDAVSLIIAFFARKIARAPADAEMTFGYGRAEVVGALVNYTTLIVVGCYLAFEAIVRFFEPTAVDGWLVVIIAGVALIVDGVTAALTYSMSKTSVNIRAAFLHNLADALGSVAVIVAGTLIILFDWRIIDPIVTLMIAGYILWLSFAEIGGVVRILMLGSPPDLKIDTVMDAILSVDGVSDVHHVHLWQMQEHENALDAHVVIAPNEWGRADGIKQQVKTTLQERFAISHSTLETECSEHACDEALSIGHSPEDEAESAHGHHHAHAH